MSNTPLRAGDVIVFDGGDTSDLVHLATNVLSNGIECVTQSNLSHAAMLWPMDVPVNGKAQTELYIIESTIRDGRNGVQLNPLAQRVAEHGRTWALRLSARIRAYIDWGTVWATATGKLDRDKYNVGEILMYLLRHVPVVQEIPQLYQSTPGAEVCSELVAELLRAGGIPGLRPATISPQILSELRIYAECIQLAGEPAAIARFNSV
jgi:hypothetical protein